MSIRIKRRFFEGPMCDEVALAARSRQQLISLSSPPTKAEILSLGNNSSADLATRIFYDWLVLSHGDFISMLNAFPSDNIRPTRHDVKILVLPGMFYKEHPEVGADGGLAVEIARRFGFDAVQLEFDSTGSVTDNSRILYEYVVRVAQDDIWLLSLSKGSSDARHCLQNYPFNSKIKGWINVAGIYKGSPLADMKLSTPLRRAMSRMLCALVGVDYQTLCELKTTHPFWQRSDWPSPLEMIHVVPVPLAAHVQGALRARHRQLLRKGPNDGFIPVTDVLSMPGHVYPVWGSDHFLRTPELSPLLYRLFNYISHKTHKHGRRAA